MKTYNDVFLKARKTLRDAGIEASSIEARLIVTKASGKTKEQFTRDMRLYATEDFEAETEKLLKRRLEGEPVAYITGEWEFYGLPMNVTSDVLIPRTDTELLAGLAIEELNSRESGTRILDLCCGSGCVGQAITANVPACRVVYADNSAKALNVCRSNLLLNGLTKTGLCIELDALCPPPMLIGSFDMIVCNPPYIPTSDINGLDASVRDYEPSAALDGGDDGLKFYKYIIPNWKGILREGGFILFECGIGQARDVIRIMEQNGYKDTEIFTDTLGIERVCKGKV